MSASKLAAKNSEWNEISTKQSGSTRRRAAPMTHLAVCISSIVSFGLWFCIFGSSTNLYQEVFGNSLVVPITVFACAAALIAIFDFAVGTRGGIDRLLGVLAGLTLISPLVGFLGSSLWVAIFP